LQASYNTRPGVAKRRGPSVCGPHGQAADSDPVTLWFLDWMWCFPLIVLSVVIHVAGLGLISEKVVQPLSALAQNRRFTVSFVIIMGVVAWLVTALHALEGFAWALAYRLLGAVGDMTDAVLYSFSAMTAYGHASVVLERRWQLMGALEALNGLMLFGLTTAFMFAMIGRVGRRRPGRGLTLARRGDGISPKQ
jgi:hypothetical protein